MARSSPVATVVPGSGAVSRSVVTGLPVPSTASTDQPGVPSSCGAASRRTAGSTWLANPASGARSRVALVNRTPGRSWIAFLTRR